MVACQNCQASPATVHLTEIKDKDRRELHLCTKCAQERGITLKTDFSLGEIFGGLIEPSSPSKAGGQQEKQDKQDKEKRDSRTICPRCGLSYLEFRKTGRLGCPDDYEVFKKGLIPFLEKIHLDTRHVGKVPSRADKRTQQVKELVALRRQLTDLVARAAYEEAARVRDRIKTMEERAEKAERAEKEERSGGV